MATSLFKRVAKIVESHVNERSEQAVTPESQLALARQQLLVQAGDLKAALGEVSYQRSLCDQEIVRLEAEITNALASAQEAVARGEEQEAREWLLRKQHATDRLAKQRIKRDVHQRQAGRLEVALRDLREQLHDFDEKRADLDARTRLAKAEATAANARTLLVDATREALAKKEEEALVAEARVLITRSIDDEFEQMLRDHQKK
ncbi:PspA/IM30 family protein [Ferroacidibacillus organovorans]|uniref:Phage shock protein A n=1 Tax=Ferroacidibacillus organovorans TaxID=1765683 RepID=A0A117SYK7_9BACL|nr:hypothetical protein [Ferroacidibacillus organovorans]KUO97081.1 hypothetical protein ATW55_12255 [Ferroacidibacillus organovorans]